MVWRILGAIGVTGASLVLVAALWVATHLRDLPAVDDADLRAIPAVAPEADAAPALYRAKSLLSSTAPGESIPGCDLRVTHSNLSPLMFFREAT
ncbi:MAG TPA: hypothetical protein VKM54_24845 [Myxococcota bacterium]|nr:hypothetical protein [Myxococcota bacterium]